MKTTTVLAAAGLALLTQAPNAFALLVFTPPWMSNPSDPQWQGGVVTSQGWEFAADPLAAPTAVNPFGPPTIQFTQASPSTATDFPGTSGSINTWHVDNDGGGFTLYIPDNPFPWDRKVIHLQYTSDKASMGPPISSPAGAVSPGGVVGHGGAWYTYEWMIEIRPNPNFETIWVPFPQSTDIEEIWVHTICVPEPATWAMGTVLGLAALGGARIVRRRVVGR